MSKEIIDAIAGEGPIKRAVEPIGDGHDSERIWHKDKYVMAYRKVMADEIGIDVDDLPEHLYVHHIDGDRMNNDIDNLLLGTKKAHQALELIVDPSKYDPE